MLPTSRADGINGGPFLGTVLTEVESVGPSSKVLSLCFAGSATAELRRQTFLVSETRASPVLALSLWLCEGISCRIQRKKTARADDT